MTASSALSRRRHFTEYAPAATAAGVLIAAALFLGLLVNHDLSLHSELTNTKVPASMTQVMPTPPEAKADAATLRALFGEVVVDKPKEAVVAPETRLDLELQATFTLSDRTKDYALLKDSSGTVRSVRVSEEVSTGAVLKSVDSGSVTLSRNGRDEVLHLPLMVGKSRRSADAPPPPPVAPQSFTPVQPAPQTAQTAPAPSTAQVSSHEPSPPLSPEAELRRQKLMERLRMLREKR